MSDIRYLTETEVRASLDGATLRRRLAAALVAHSRGEAVVPPRISAIGPSGLVGAMPGYVPGVGMAAKLVTVFPGNHGTGRPSHQGVIVVFDPDNGEPLAIMDAFSVTAVRTAATAALAADLVSRKDSQTLAIIGAGTQGREHLAAFAGVRAWREIRIASPNADRASALAATDDRARVTTIEQAVRGADVICCCTDARSPVLDPGWVAAGAHVSSVGTFGELPAALVPPPGGGPVFVEWRGAARFAPPAGAPELQGLPDEALSELGEVIDGVRPGRTEDAQITVYKSTGHAVEDIAAAAVVLDAAQHSGAGRSLPR